MANTDPIKLAAEARGVIAPLHGRGDVVVRFKTNTTGFREDALSELEEEDPGHFNPDNIVLTMNLDKLISRGKAFPESLATIEDFRKYPVLAGVAAHESAHAKFSLWNTKEHPIPERIANPDYDPANPTRTVTKTRTEWDEAGVATEIEEHTEVPVPEFFSVSETGKLVELAKELEEPRVERLGTGAFTKTWRRAMQFSAGHFVMEGVDEDDESGKNPLDAAVSLAIRVGGRSTAGTLGNTFESRASVKKVLSSVQEIIEKALKDKPDAHPDPYHAVMGIINRQVFNNDHTDALSHIEAARQILKIIHPETQDNPDEPGPGDGGAEGEGAGAGAGGMTAAEAAAMAALGDELREAVDAFGTDMQELVRSEEEAPDQQQTQSAGHGSVLYKNPRAPGIAYHEEPTAEDRELYHRALAWMEKQIEPTITESEVNQWLPVGGARLDLRSYLRDNMANHRANQRSDWKKTAEAIKTAPPVKVGIMLDGSGSMSSYARHSASVAWAAANAAAALPESRTVSVVYGNAAAVTQEPGHNAPRKVAVSNTNGGTEEFIDAAQLVEDALWLNDPIEEGQPSNVLIIIVSDLQYGGHNDRLNEPQSDGFLRISKEWVDKGYQVVVVGADRRDGIYINNGGRRGYVKLDDPILSHIQPMKIEELFR